MVALAPLPFRASKRFTLYGREVLPGEIVDVSGLPAPRVLNMETARVGQRVAADLLPPELEQEPRQVAPPGDDGMASGSVDLPSPDPDAAPDEDEDELELDDDDAAVDAGDLLGIGEEIILQHPHPVRPAPAKAAKKATKKAGGRRSPRSPSADRKE